MTPTKATLNSLFHTDSEEKSTVYAVASDVASFIERSFHEALSYQYLREFWDNADAAGASNIVIEPDWVHVENCVAAGVGPVYRWSIWDDGHGMSIDDLERFRKVFNSSKGSLRGRHVNFGIGAKISGLPINPKGLIIMSWQDGIGHMIVYHKDVEGQYGLYRQHVEDDEGNIQRQEVAPTSPQYDHFYNPESGQKERRVNGTLIIFIGSTTDEHTYLGPANQDWAEKQNRINILTLNRRFSHLTNEHQTTYVYDPAFQDYKAWAKSRAEACKTLKGRKGRVGQYRVARGAFAAWDVVASEKGTVSISDGKVHWWLFRKVHKDEVEAIGNGAENRLLANIRDRKKVTDGTPLDPFDGKECVDFSQTMWNSHSYTWGAGVSAALYKGELYDPKTHTQAGGYHRFNYFGVYDKEVRGRVVIVVEPAYSENTGVWPNSVRSMLHYEDAEGLPWDRWGAEFVAQMPEPLRLLLETSGQFKNTKDLDARIKNNVSDVLKEYGLRPTGLRGKGSRGPAKNSSKGPNPNLPTRRRRTVPSARKGAIPSWQVITKSADPNPNRPAVYNVAANRLDFFAGYHLFQEVTRHWLETFSHIPDAEGFLENIVIEVYVSMLVARITHILSLEGQTAYTKQDVRAMLSPEAFVTAVAGYVDAHREILPRIRKLKVPVPVAV